MLPALRTLASAKLALFTVASTLAPGAVATTHTRVVKDRATGVAITKHVTRAPRYVLCDGARATAERVLQLNLQNARRVQASPQLWSEVELGEAGLPVLPPLYTSGRELSQKRRVTDRTIRNHMRELKAAGIVVRYQFRGREHAYCVWINPNLVWETPAVDLSNYELASSVAPADSPNGKNFPVNEVLEPQEPLKFEITRVEKLVGGSQPGGAVETGTPLTGTAGSPSGCEPAPQASKSGAGAARREKFYLQAGERAQGALQAEKKRICVWFWTYAKALIYKGQTFTPDAERLALRAIWRGVFHSFSTGGPAEWARWNEGLARRVELVAAWLQRNPGKYPPLPYAEAVPGRGYFDAENARGFAATEKWLTQELRNKRIKGKGGVSRSIDEAVAELGQRQRLDAGQKRVQASKRAKKLDFNRLHAYHYQKLRGLGGDDALYQFAARLQAEHILSLPSLT